MSLNRRETRYFREEPTTQSRRQSKALVHCTDSDVFVRAFKISSDISVFQFLGTCSYIGIGSDMLIHVPSLCMKEYIAKNERKQRKEVSTRRPCPAVLKQTHTRLKVGICLTSRTELAEARRTSSDEALHGFVVFFLNRRLNAKQAVLISSRTAGLRGLEMDGKYTRNARDHRSATGRTKVMK